MSQLSSINTKLSVNSEAVYQDIFRDNIAAINSVIKGYLDGCGSSMQNIRDHLSIVNNVISHSQVQLETGPNKQLHNPEILINGTDFYDLISMMDVLYFRIQNAQAK